MPSEKKVKNQNPMADVVYRLFKLNALYGIFSFLIIFVSSAVFENAQTGLLVTSTASCVLFCCSFYLEAWHFGSRELGLEHYGRSDFKRQKGAVAGLLSQLPGLFTVILAIVFFEKAGIFKYLCLFQQVLYSPFTWLFSILEGAQPFIFLLPVPLMPIFTYAGYLVGHTGKPLYSLLFKKDGSPPAR